MPLVTFICNGSPTEIAVPADRRLVDVLREDLAFTGTKVGCGTGDCGSCTVLLDGAPVNACLAFAAECDSRTVETVEGVARTRVGEAVIRQLVANGAIQCGFCTPGIVVMASALLADTAAPDPDEVVDALAGNLCRCTGYLPLIVAILRAARELEP